IRHPLVEERIVKLSEYGDSWEINRIENRSAEIGIICTGVTYHYVREALPEVSTLKLGMVYPLPKSKILEFAASVKKLYIVEELDPFIEEQVRAMGIPASGKELIPLCGELSPGRIRKAFAAAGIIPASQMDVAPAEKLIPRPPNM